MKFFFSYRLIFWIYSTRLQFSHRIEGVVEASFLCWFFKITQNWLLFSDSWVTLQCQIIVSHFIYTSATTTGDFYRRKTMYWQLDELKICSRILTKNLLLKLPYPLYSNHSLSINTTPPRTRTPSRTPDQFPGHYS